MKKIQVFEDGSFATFEQQEGISVEAETVSLKDGSRQKPIHTIDDPTDEEIEAAKKGKAKFDKKTGKLKLLTD